MAYTNPTPTLADSALITKAHMDILYNNLMWLQRRPLNLAGITASGQTTSSGTLAVISGTAWNINIPTATNMILVAMAHMSLSNANGYVTFGMAIDGSYIGAQPFNSQCGAGIVQRYIHATYAAVPAGVHNFQAMWAAYSNTVRLNAGYGNHILMWEVGV